MKSSRRTTASQRRTHYLDTALRLFTEHGYHGVSIDDIVAASGGSKATLYRYFESKEALFSAMVDELQSTLANTPPPDDVADLPLTDALRILGRATASAALSDRALVLLRLAIGEHGRFPELGRILFELAPGRSYERFTTFLANRQASGEVEVDDHQIAAEQFLAGIVGHQQLRMLLVGGAPTPEEIEHRVEAAVRMFVRTYAAHRPSLG